ncbi:3126_t:CDS:10 [Ambispora leptoticha]|uniref:3126_t:CDS:1 n=1 Tax=Ambispora leptoticha TaxID=144679 RepID=A0A9N8V6H1_9GLOM|nr:3126_t:CDS:10 [Ambispora leptoticha]
MSDLLEDEYYERHTDNHDNDNIKREEHEEMKKTYLREACLALGSREKTLLDDGQVEDVYVIGDLCKYALRNIIELIRMDRPLVITYLSNLNILEKDLFPIVTLNRNSSNKNEKNLTYGCVDLFIQMTESLQGDSNLLEEDVIDEDLIVEQKTKQLAAQEAQQRFKELFIRNPIALETVRDLLCENLEQEKWKRTKEERTEARNIIGCCLFFFRNLAGIQESSTLLDNTHKLQSQLIVLFHEKEILRLLVDIASNHKKMEDWYYLVQEIFYFIFFGVRPKDMFVDLSKKYDETFEMGRVAYYESGLTFTVHGQKPSLDPGPQLPDRGRKKFRKTKNLDEFDKTKSLTPIALNLLKETATELIDYGGLNEMIFYVKKGIEHQKAEIHPDDHVKLLYMIRFFIEMELLLINESQKPLPLRDNYNGKKNHPLSPLTSPLPLREINFNLVQSIMNINGFSFILKKLDEFREKKSWGDLHYAIECFLHMLNYIQEMNKSSYSEDKKDASALLSDIFSEAATFDMILGIVKDYKTQSLGYLQSVIEMIDVFFRLLEQYLATSHLYTRKKRVARKKKKTKAKKAKETAEQEAVSINDKTEDVQKNEEQEAKKYEYEDVEFKFESFQSRFANESMVKIYSTLLDVYDWPNTRTIQHITNMFNRIAVKCRGIGLFFKLSTLEIFNRTLIRLQKLPKSPVHLDLEDFIKFCVRQFVKAAKSDPSLFASVLLPKRRGDYILSSEEDNLPNSSRKDSIETSVLNTECFNEQEQTIQSNVEASGEQEHSVEQFNLESTGEEEQNVQSKEDSLGSQEQNYEVDPEQENGLQSNSNNINSTKPEREIEIKSREPFWKRYSKKTKHATGSKPASNDKYNSDYSDSNSNVIVGGSSKGSTIESSPPNNLDSNLSQGQSSRIIDGDDHDEDDNYEFTVNLAPIVKGTDYEDENATRVANNGLSSSLTVGIEDGNNNESSKSNKIMDIDEDNEFSISSKLIIENFKDREQLKSIYIEDEAEESEDEYKGMGGSDKEDDDDDVAELMEFINNDMNKENTDSLDVQNLFQQQILEEDQAEVARIQRDLEKGRIGKRRRNNIGGLFDDDDDSDDAEQKKRSRANYSDDDDDEKKMYSLAQRANSIFAFAMTVIFGLLGAIAFVSPYLPSSPTASINIQDMQVWIYDYGGSWHEFAFVNMDIDADLTSLFNWNTKQLFVTVVAEYESETHDVNQIVLWDSVIRSKEDANITLKQLQNKYNFHDISPSFSGLNATYSLHWDIMPHVGGLKNGQVKAVTEIKFPAPENKPSK